MTQTTRQTLDEKCIVVNDANKANDTTARRLSLKFKQVLTDAQPAYDKFYQGLQKPRSIQGQAAIKTHIVEVRIRLIIDKTM
jgi:hypothetical protein